jgi:uncharacterized protein YxjI
MARYKMLQRLLSIGGDFTIEDDEGRPAFKVDGKVMKIRRTFVIEDMAGKEVATVRQKLLAVRKTMHVLRGDEEIATVRKALLTPFRQKYMVEVAGGEELEVQGEVLEHEYDVRRGDHVVARISKRWFTIRDTYGIEIADGEDDALLLAVAVAIDEISQQVEDDANQDDG